MFFVINLKDSDIFYVIHLAQWMIFSRKHGSFLLQMQISLHIASKQYIC